MNSQLIKKTDDFISKYNINSICDEKTLLNSLVKDMELGLKKDPAAQQPMIVMPYNVNNEILNENVIVLDAGGTNFRSCIVKKNSEGKFEVSDFIKTKMPGSEGCLKKDEFYNKIADNIEHLKNASKRIGFCFSYAMEITDEGDGKILLLAKEVKTEGVEGTYVAKELKNVLLQRGWDADTKIVMINDAASVLLSSMSQIAIILGTGLNTCYVDNGKPVVTECGLFSSLETTEGLLNADASSAKKGTSLLEKSTSGAYRKNIFVENVKLALKENVFESELNFVSENDILQKAVSITPKELDELYEKCNSENTVECIFSKLIQAQDKRAQIIIKNVLLSCVEKANMTESCKGAINIACNGSTFWKTPGFADSVKKLMEDHYDGKISFNFINTENDTLIGSAMATFLI